MKKDLDIRKKNARKVLIIASRAELLPEHETELKKLLQNGVDWAELMCQAITHRMMNMIWFHIKRLDLGSCIEKDMSNLFELHYRGIEIKQRQFFTELDQISTQFKDNNIRALLLKGGVLAHTVYPAPPTRYFNDLDFLIDIKSVNGVTKALNELGFVQGDYDAKTGTIKEANKRQRIFHQISTHELQEFVKLTVNPLARAIPIDINHSILWVGNCPYTIETEKLIERATLINVGGVEVWSLCKEDFLLQLCCHLYREATLVHWIEDKRDLKLYKFADIYNFIEHHKTALDWTFFLAESKKHNLDKLIYFVFRRVHELYECETLKPVMQTCMPDDFDYLDEYMLADGSICRWQQPFFDRLFDMDRVQETMAENENTANFFAIKEVV